jgi:hypothetical protein
MQNVAENSTTIESGSCGHACQAFSIYGELSQIEAVICSEQRAVNLRLLMTLHTARLRLLRLMDHHKLIGLPVKDLERQLALNRTAAAALLADVV